MTTGLELSSISKTFGNNRVLEDLSLSVSPGEFVSLVGPSGCGKSTLLRIIAGLEVQDGGHVNIAGRQVDHLGPRERNIAMVFQSYALYPHMSAFENIALPLLVSQLSFVERLPLLEHLSPRRRSVMRRIRADVESVAEQLKIGPLLGRKPGQLSGGQRQRVALARAMVRQPSLFLMDEPLSNLDAQLRVHMRDELASLHQRLGATFVYVTHDQVEAMTMSTRIAMMDRGRLAQVGSPGDLYERPATLAVAQFIGSPTINVLPGRIGTSGHVTLADRPLGLRVPGGEGTAVSVAIRPEAIRLVPQDGLIDGRIRRVEHHGAEQLVYVVPDVEALAAAGPLIVRLSDAEQLRGDGAIAPGSRISLVPDVRRVHVFGSDGSRMPGTTPAASAHDHHGRVAEVAAVMS